MTERANPTNLCICGHVDEAHEHFRRGDDCGVCGREACAHFRPAAARVAETVPADPGSLPAGGESHDVDQRPAEGAHESFPAR